MVRGPDPNGGERVAVRLPKPLLDRTESLAANILRDERYMHLAGTRSDVIRVVLQAGVLELEAQYGLDLGDAAQPHGAMSGVVQDRITRASS